MKLGVLIGSFDPIHIGHLYMATSAINEGYVDKVVFVPTVQNPWKENKPSSFYDRITMTYKAIKGLDKLTVSDIECNATEPYYTSNTLKLLQKEYPNDKICLIVGADIFLTIEKWYEGTWILNNFEIITVARDGFDGDIKGTIDISSTKIREMIKNNKELYPLVPSNVIKYIKEYNLYKQ